MRTYAASRKTPCDEMNRIDVCELLLYDGNNFLKTQNALMSCAGLYKREYFLLSALFIQVIFQTIPEIAKQM